MRIFALILSMLMAGMSYGAGPSTVMANSSGIITAPTNFLTVNMPSLSAKALGAIGNGIADDTTALTSALAVASASGSALDLKGATYGVTSLSISTPVKIINGTIKEISTYTNTGGMVSVTSSNVVFDQVNIDGDSKSLRGLRLNAGSTGFRFIGGKLSNFSQPSGLGVQSCAVLITDGCEFYFGGGWSISNVTAVANAVIGDDAGASRGFYIVNSGGGTQTRGIIEDGTISEIKSSGSSANEDADGISVHSWGAGVRVPVVIQNVHFINARKRWVKIIGEGVTVNNLDGSNDGDGTNWTMNAMVSVYGSHSKVSNVRAPMSAFSYIVDCVNNGVPIYDVSISNCSLVGTNGFMSPTAEGIRVGGADGVYGARVFGNQLGTSWAPFLIGLHFAGGVTNYSATGNIIWASEEGILDGNKYSGESTWTTNQFGVIAANVIPGTPSSGAIRLKRTANLTLGQNSVPTGYPISFDNGYAATTLTGAAYSQTISGGSFTGLTSGYIGDTVLSTWNSEVPDFQVNSSIGTNVLSLLRFSDGTYNRLLMTRVDTNGVFMDISQSTGGNGVFEITKGGNTILHVDSAGAIKIGSSTGPALLVGTGAPSTSSYGNGSQYWRTDGTGPNLYVRENGAWVAK